MTDWQARETRDGETLTRRVWALLADAEAAAGLEPGTLVVTQGSWSAGSLSGSTHLGGGAFDLRTWNLPAAKVEPLVVELRRRNVCAWLRDRQHGGFDPHIHGIVRDEPGLSSGARWQVQQYDLGRNGLSNLGRDYHPRPTQHHWEPDMPLTDAEIEKIAEAVWRRAVKVDGEQRRMGAMAVACFKAAKVQLPAGEADEAP